MKYMAIQLQKSIRIHPCDTLPFDSLPPWIVAVLHIGHVAKCTCYTFSGKIGLS